MRKRGKNENPNIFYAPVTRSIVSILKITIPDESKFLLYFLEISSLNPKKGFYPDEILIMAGTATDLRITSPSILIIFMRILVMDAFSGRNLQESM